MGRGAGGQGAARLRLGQGTGQRKMWGTAGPRRALHGAFVHQAANLALRTGPALPRPEAAIRASSLKGDSDGDCDTDPATLNGRFVRPWAEAGRRQRSERRYHAEIVPIAPPFPSRAAKRAMSGSAASPVGAAGKLGGFGGRGAKVAVASGPAPHLGQGPCRMPLGGSRAATAAAPASDRWAESRAVNPDGAPRAISPPPAGSIPTSVFLPAMRAGWRDLAWAAKTAAAMAGRRACQ